MVAVHQALSSSAGGVSGARVWSKLVQCSASVAGLNIGADPSLQRPVVAWPRIMRSLPWLHHTTIPPLAGNTRIHKVKHTDRETLIQILHVPLCCMGQKRHWAARYNLLKWCLLSSSAAGRHLLSICHRVYKLPLCCHLVVLPILQQGARTQIPTNETT